MKKEVSKMYIPIIEKKFLMGTEKWENRVRLVCANKIKELEQYLPCKEALQVHMQIQHVELEKDESYKPKPLYITIGRERFKDLIKRISGRISHKYEDHIPLVLQYPSIPICIIQPAIEDGKET